MTTRQHAYNGADIDYDKPHPRNYGHTLEFQRITVSKVRARCTECRCHGMPSGSKDKALTEFRRECGRLGHWCPKYTGERE